MESVIALLTLITLEVILGLDNVIFISDHCLQASGRATKKSTQLGAGNGHVHAFGAARCYLMDFKTGGEPFFVMDNDISGKDIILILGGLFLIYKSTVEIYHKMEGVDGDKSARITVTTFSQVLVQILLLDLVFSVDSIITAVGMVKELWIMYTAVVVTVIIMLFASEPISRFINKHPAFKILALSFLLLIGMSLMAEGLDFHIPKGYIYFSMAFAFLVDVIQMKVKKKSDPVHTHEHYKKI